MVLKIELILGFWSKSLIADRQTLWDVTPTLLQLNKRLSTANNGSIGRARAPRHTATYHRMAQNTQNKPNFPSRWLWYHSYIYIEIVKDIYVKNKLFFKQKYKKG